jgi:hypothetical protein
MAFLPPAFRQSVLERPGDARWPWLAAIVKLRLRLASPPAALAICATFAIVAALRRKTGGAWSYALAAGFAFPFALAHWFTG